MHLCKVCHREPETILLFIFPKSRSIARLWFTASLCFLETRDQPVKYIFTNCVDTSDLSLLIILHRSIADYHTTKRIPSAPLLLSQAAVDQCLCVLGNANKTSLGLTAQLLARPVCTDSFIYKLYMIMG